MLLDERSVAKRNVVRNDAATILQIAEVEDIPETFAEEDVL